MSDSPWAWITFGGTYIAGTRLIDYFIPPSIDTVIMGFMVSAVLFALWWASEHLILGVK